MDMGKGQTMATRPKAFFIAAAALLAVGCQETASSLRPAGLTQAAPTTSSPRAAMQAECPPSGLIMRTTEGREFHFLGRDPSDSEICLWSTTGSRSISRQLFALWPATASTGQFHREGLRPLFPFAAGKSATYTAATTDGFWRYNWRVIGEQRITVPAGEFDVWVIEFTEDSSTGAFRGERMFYIDKVTHVPVRVDSQVVRGRAAYTAPWQAISMTRASH